MGNPVGKAVRMGLERGARASGIEADAREFGSGKRSQDMEGFRGRERPD